MYIYTYFVSRRLEKRVGNRYFDAVPTKIVASFCLTSLFLSLRWTWHPWTFRGIVNGCSAKKCLTGCGLMCFTEKNSTRNLGGPQKARSKLQSFGIQVFICYVCICVRSHSYLYIFVLVCACLCVYTYIFTCKPWTSVNAYKFQPVPWSISQYHGFQKTGHSWFIMGGEPSLAKKTWFGRIHAHKSCKLVMWWSCTSKIQGFQVYTVYKYVHVCIHGWFPTLHYS